MAPVNFSLLKFSQMGKIDIFRKIFREIFGEIIREKIFSKKKFLSINLK